MKILIIDESINRVGGVERVISTLANKLCDNNEVFVLSEYKSSDKPFYMYNKNVKIKYLIDSQKYITNRLKSKNLKYYIFRAIEKVRDTIILNRKIKEEVCKLNDFDLIIFGRVFTALDFFRNVKRKINSKVIVRDAIHLEYYTKKIQNDMKKYFPKYVDKFIVSSDESINNYGNFFNSNSVEIKKIYNPLGIIPNCGYSYNNKTIVSIGRLDNQKGFENLISAFKIVYSNNNDWHLKIYGSGNYESKLKNEIKKYNLETAVEILPTTKNVVDVFNNSSIFVLPSRYEGYANILVEAMACGIPSISYNWLMGAEEIIDDKVNGIIVKLNDRYKYFNGEQDCDDIQNLANAIEYLISNPAVCESFSKKSISIVESRNIDNILDEWLKIIC